MFFYIHERRWKLVKSTNIHEEVQIWFIFSAGITTFAAETIQSRRSVQGLNEPSWRSRRISPGTDWTIHSKNFTLQHSQASKTLRKRNQNAPIRKNFHPSSLPDRWNAPTTIPKQFQNAPAPKTRPSSLQDHRNVPKTIPKCICHKNSTHWFTQTQHVSRTIVKRIRSKNWMLQLPRPQTFQNKKKTITVPLPTTCFFLCGDNL